MTTTADNHYSHPSRRRRKAVLFLIETASKLKTPPVIKYSALTLFADRFLPTITTTISHHHHHLLRHPLNHSTLQLFSLVSIWISSKIHSSPPLPLSSLKLIGDDQITEQHYTKSDYLDAEIVFLQCVGFEIGTMRNSVFLIVEELLRRFMEVSRIAEMVDFEACLDVIDLAYEKERISRLLLENSMCFAAGVVVAVFVMTVPKQMCEFPVVAWVKFVTGCREADVVSVVRVILENVVEST